MKKLGMFATARSIVRVEGIGGLYRGIKPAIARHIPYTGTRVMLYDFLRTKIVGDQPLGKDGKKPGLFAYLFHTKMTCFYTYNDVIILTLRTFVSAPTFVQRLLVGFSSGAIAQTVAVPMDVCKIRMQADGLAVAAGKKARYTGLIDALTKITKAEGVRFFKFYI